MCISVCVSVIMSGRGIMYPYVFHFVRLGLSVCDSVRISICQLVYVTTYVTVRVYANVYQCFVPVPVS